MQTIARNCTIAPGKIYCYTQASLCLNASYIFHADTLTHRALKEYLRNNDIYKQITLVDKNESLLIIKDLQDINFLSTRS